VELVLAAGLELVQDRMGLPAPFAGPAPVVLLVEAGAPRDPELVLGDAVAGLEGVLDAAVAVDAARRRDLWRYREDHTLAIASLGVTHKLDVTLPAAALAAFVEEAPGLVAAAVPVAAGVQTWLFGHAADGNVHVNVTGLDAGDDRVDDAVLRAVAERGGSISAEHGIGRAKRPWLHLARTPEEIRAMRSIKQALDPAGVLNPAVLLPPP
jgi:FAD/FMN-containing dehydrogenase